MQAAESELTLRQAAELVNLTRSRLQQLIGAGRLSSRMVELPTGQSIHLVRRDDVLALSGQKLPRGPKPKPA